MQVFIVGSVEETAQALDKRRLNKQIIECNQILDALYGVGKGWFNHPIVKMYKGYEKWLCCYKWYLEEYQRKDSDLLMLMHYNKFCEDNKPPFLTEDYFNQMKRRLYTKDNNHYKQWEELGKSGINWYFVDNEWRYYKNGKQIKLN
jgi:hypothetical protein